MARLSGLQKDVTKLYRMCIRQVKTKPVENQPRFREYIRSEFGKYRTSIARKDFATIEYLLRKGFQKLEYLKEEQVRNIH